MVRTADAVARWESYHNPTVGWGFPHEVRSKLCIYKDFSRDNNILPTENPISILNMPTIHNIDCSSYKAGYGVERRTIIFMSLALPSPVWGFKKQIPGRLNMSNSHRV